MSTEYCLSNFVPSIVDIRIYAFVKSPQNAPKQKIYILSKLLNILLFLQITNETAPMRKHRAIGIISDNSYTGFNNPIKIPNKTKNAT